MFNVEVEGGMRPPPPPVWHLATTQCGGVGGPCVEVKVEVEVERMKLMKEMTLVAFRVG